MLDTGYYRSLRSRDRKTSSIQHLVSIRQTAPIDARSRIDLGRIDDLVNEVTALAVTVYGGENLGALNELAGLTDRLRSIEDAVAGIEDRELPADIPASDDIDSRPLVSAAQGVTDLGRSLRG